MTPLPKDVAFVLVPGGFCPGSYFHKVTERLTALGYATHEIDLPTVGKPDKPPASVYDDASHIRSVMEKFADEGKSVILAGNSYGGFVATEAVQGTTRADREKMGKPGGLVHLVYLASLLPPVGMDVLELAGPAVPVDVTEQDFLDPPPPEVAVGLVGNVSEEEVKHYGSQLKCHSARSMKNKLTYAGYLHVPTTFVISENDKIVQPKTSHENVDAVIAKGAGDITKVSLQAEHCAMLSNPDDVVKVLLEAAGQ